MTAFTIAARPHRRRRQNRSRAFLNRTARCAVEVDGVTIIGASGEWAIDAAGYRISYHEAEARRDSFWWLHGRGLDPVEAIDPHDAIAILRERDLLPKAAGS